MNNKHNNNRAPVASRLMVAIATTWLVMGSGTVQAQSKAAAKGQAKAPVSQTSSPCDRVEMGPAINVSVGKSTLLKPETAVTRILLGNPEQTQAAKPIDVSRVSGLDEKLNTENAGASRPGVADVDVVLLSPRELYLLGKTVGSTNIVLLDKSGTCTIMDVVVGMDAGALQATLKQLMPGETGIKVTAAADSLILSGIVSDSAKAARALELANAYVRSGGQGGAAGQISNRIVNMLAIAAAQQVMLEVKVAEVSKTLLDQLGASVGLSRTNGNWTYTLLSDLLRGSSSLVDVFNGKNGRFVTIDAEKRDGLIKILAEPTVMAISGQEGSFLAGGRIFIPVSQANANGVATITLEEKEFGVALKFTPTVLEGGRINLKVAPEVSELNREGVGITLSGVTGRSILPAFTTRRASTTVQLYDGQSFVIGGLIKNNVTANIRALPFLGEIPILGALFRSSDFQTDRSELIFVVTPRLVKPLPEDVPLPTDSYREPTRQEFFFGGRMEGTGEPDKKAPPAPASGYEIK